MTLIKESEIKLVTKVARLYYYEFLNQQEIADKLNISRTKVSRCLTKARNENIVEIKINSPYEIYEELEAKIEKEFNIKQCLVVQTSGSFKETCRNISAVLSELLDRIINDGDYIGIGWGNTLKTVSGFMEPLKKININLVPLIGALGKAGIEVHTNSVAGTLADKYGGLSYSIHSPAVLDSKHAKNVLENDSNIREIFKMVDKIDTALIGMSDMGADSTMIKSGNFTTDDFNYLKDLGVVGDVNLIFIDRSGNPVKNRIDERVLKISPERIKKMKNVIGVAFGEKKIEIIKASLIGEIINILITDEQTAACLV